MSTSDPFTELSREVTACQERINSLQSSLDELKGEYRKYIETQQNRSFTNVNTFLLVGLSLISSIIGAIIVKLFP